MLSDNCNRKTNRGWLCSLFVFPTEWHQTGKQRTAFTDELVFLFFLFWCCEWKMKIGITDHFPIFIFLFLNYEKGKGNLITSFLFSIMESENEKRKDGIYNTWRFFVFPVYICKRNNESRYNGSYFYFSFLCLRIGQRKRMLSYPFSIFYYEIEKRKTNGRYIHGPIWHDKHWMRNDVHNFSGVHKTRCYVSRCASR